MNFLSKKKYFKERQILYEKMSSLKEEGDTVVIDDITYTKVDHTVATHVFIWFDRKPMILEYNPDHKGYMIGNTQFHISKPNKKSNKVINFVQRH